MSLRESIAQQFACPEGKTMGQVTQEDLLHYLVLWVGLKWEWIDNSIRPYIMRARTGSLCNSAASIAAKEQEKKAAQRHE